jgi:class 3 adenylate cyclase/tetratricopeptide (TPR) repeat protein
MTCASCGAENRGGRKFCSQCGTPLAFRCPSCGAANEPGDAFCGDCGASLEGGGPPPARAEPAAERRLVSVLFADLVGFTAVSEDRDSEETRELLSAYFDICRSLISRYGGTVEKFIGDAVMAVWGTPIATEDDAERAVRAALDLVAAVPELEGSLEARAAVFTGEAAVTLGADGEGMVAGDLVNTASRAQAIAPPGAVYVGDATRRVTEQTVAYEDAGSHELRGKVGLVPLWRALRVVSGARGSLKSAGLEAPFVGRDRELRHIKDLFHASADDGKAHLVSIAGIAGIGKSRLGWEFYKYIDGIAGLSYWHRGRCLSYGEGVTYWALADMVRMRARIAEDEEAGSAAQKLTEVVEENVVDPDERRFVEPRLAHLLGLEEGSRYEREDLFAAWRLFFERLAERNPVILVFEDMQWADASLLDFIEYLLEWSRSSPIFVATLARPELLERRPTWGAGSRNFTAIYLEPLSEQAMNELLSGLVPGLPEELRRQILERAEGVPLYAVETVRMLLDRGLLVQEGSIYRPVGPVETLEIPETLHALIAARLDGLSAEERRVLQDGAVLGKTFTKQGLGALSGLAEGELDPLLASLVRKEVLSIQADPRSPEHGQYVFLQDLLRRVAYETLAKADRKAKHLAAAAFLEQALGEQEVVEVVASHYVNAYGAAPDAEDAAEIRAKAGEHLARAGERAASLGANEEAGRYFEQAAELSEEPAAKASLLDRAGQAAWKGGGAEAAIRLFESSIALYEQEGDMHAAARVSGRLAEVERWSGRIEEGLERMERAFAVISGDEPDEDLADLASRIAATQFFLGNQDLAAERIEFALEIAESLWLPPLLSRIYRRKALLARHPEESLAFLNHSLKIALDNDLPEEARFAYFISSDQSFRRDRYADALDYLERALAVNRKVGDRLQEWSICSEMTYPLYMLGRWEESLAVFAEVPEEQIRTAGLLLSPLTSVLELHVHRGNVEEAERILSLYSRVESSADVQDHSAYQGAVSALRRAQGRHGEALEAGLSAFEDSGALGVAAQGPKQGFIHAVEAALELGEHGKAMELLAAVEVLPRGRRPPYLEAQAARLRARMTGNVEGYKGAAALFRELGMPFWLAVTLLEQGEPRGLEEAREIFERLEATPWLERLDALAPEPAPAR